MANTLAELKKNAKTSVEHLRAQIEKLNTKGQGRLDERFWAPTVDEHGNGSAIIRFLPAPCGEDDL